MRVKKNIFLAIVLVVVNVTACLADDPSPPGISKPDNFPIDNNLVFLMIAGLSLGLLIIYKNKIKKASI